MASMWAAADASSGAGSRWLGTAWLEEPTRASYTASFMGPSRGHAHGEAHGQARAQSAELVGDGDG